MKWNVLVVEDDPASSELMSVWLGSEGYDVRCTADLQSSRDAIRAAAPDLILLDIGLGTENGLDLAAWLRKDQQMTSIPVIAVTAHAMVSERERIYSCGCNAFLPKPVDFEELRLVLNDCLSREREKRLARL